MADKTSPHASVLSPNSKSNLRTKTAIQKFKESVIGCPVTCLPNSKLPTKKIILSRYYGIKQERNLRNGNKNFTDKEAADLLVQELVPIWEKAALPTIRIDKIKAKILKLVKDFDLKLKNWSRFDGDQTEDYRLSLLNLFDIAVSNLKTVLQSTSKTNKNWQEDFQFYLNQCQVPQIGSLGSQDVMLKKREERKFEKKDKAEKQAIKEKERRQTSTIEKDSTSQEDQEFKEGDTTYTPSKWQEWKAKGGTEKADDNDDLIKITTPTAVRFGLSVRAHSAMTASVSQSLQTEKKVVSVSTTFRKRKLETSQKAARLKEEFKENYKSMPKIIHWDSKIMDVVDLKGIKEKDINSIVLTVPGVSVSTVIGIPETSSGTGLDVAECTLTKAKEWTDLEDIFGCVFDTTSSNTGIMEGAVTHIESARKSKVLWLACRHHVSELIIKHVYTDIVAPSKGPDEPLFKAFKEWFVLQQEKDDSFPPKDTFKVYDWGAGDQGYANGPYLKDENWYLRQTLDWLQDHLQKGTFPRGDYLELCQLMIFILGGNVSIDFLAIYILHFHIHSSFNQCLYILHIVLNI